MQCREVNTSRYGSVPRETAPLSINSMQCFQRDAAEKIKTSHIPYIPTCAYPLHGLATPMQPKPQAHVLHLFVASLR